MKKISIFLLLVIVFIFVGLAVIYWKDFDFDKENIYLKFEYDLGKQKPLILRKYDNEYFEFQIIGQTNKLVPNHDLKNYNIVSKDSLLNLFYSTSTRYTTFDKFNFFIICSTKNNQNTIIAVNPNLILED